MNIEQTRNQITAATIKAVGTRAAEEYFYNVLGGEDRGTCGFAWVWVMPQHNGRTKAGKAERQTLAELGFEKSYSGAFKLYASYPVQSIDVQEREARAMAQFLQEQGYTAHTQTFVD